MFALASRFYGLPSETFITAHAAHIAPGRTALLTYGTTPDGFAGPVIANLESRPQVRHAPGRETRRDRLPLSRFVPIRERAIARFLRDIDATCVMAEYGNMGVEMLGGTRRAGVPLYCHFHGYDASSHLRFPRIVASYQALFREGAGFFAPSRFIADRLIGVGCPPDRIDVTPCGIDPAHFPASARQPGRCLAVGRFVDKKAPLITLRAFLEVAPDHPEARLDFVGDGPLLAACQAEAAASPAGRQVVFHGALDHGAVRDMMREASVFLQHSVTAPNGDTEGLPVAILEAMCSGLAVISTVHSGIPEAVEHGQSGLLVEEGDGAAMARALAGMLDDPATGDAIGAAARDRAIARFSIAHTAGRLRTGMNLA